VVVQLFQKNKVTAFEVKHLFDAKRWLLLYLFHQDVTDGAGFK
jgi:hypothetical protein